MTILIRKISIITAVLLLSNLSFGQTTAMDFQGNDCNGNPVHLFQDLEDGKAVILIYYMPVCGSCPPVAHDLQTMGNNINAEYPGRVKAYSFPYQDITDCAYSASWVVDNNLPLFTPMNNGAAALAYYGEFAMPTVVLLGGNNHDVMMVLDQGWDVSDTVAMRDSIIGYFTANVKELNTVVTSLDIFPNPTAEIVTIQFNLTETSDVLFEIVDLAGRVLYTDTDEKMSEGIVKKELSVFQLPNGTYFINVLINGHKKSEKINIKH